LAYIFAAIAWVYLHSNSFWWAP